ncbi:MAG: stimulus-sensing domain-containing protein [Alphaproteobacteria bacterium]
MAGKSSNDTDTDDATRRSSRRRGPISALTRRIVGFNLVGLVLMLAGVTYVNTLRSDLIEERIGALLTEGEIIAGAIGAGAITPEATVIDYRAARNLLRRLAVPAGSRGRLFSQDGFLLADTRQHLFAGQVVAYELPPPNSEWGAERVWNEIRGFVRGLFDSLDGEVPLYNENVDQDASDYGEVVSALQGVPARAVRKTAAGELIVSVAVPVTRFKVVLGALMLSTEAGDIDEVVRAGRLQLILVFMITGSVAVLLSVLLASAIAQPVRRLAEAADRVRQAQVGRIEIPDLSYRRDEIGDLSGSLRSMTDALYNRIDDIESFAADVAHELKNPLTSLKSAIETLQYAKTDDQKERLNAVILHDVKRMDRLISDISNASRIDAELQREGRETVSIPKLLETLIDVNNMTLQDESAPSLHLEVEGSAEKLTVSGIESRLGQVVQNLISNAVTFSKPGDVIRLTTRRNKNLVEILVEDEGPGIPPHNLEKIFDRFHTERPEAEGFGNHSGLGLAISRQIVDAHGGIIQAENRAEGGARFVVRLPFGSAD